MRRIAHIDMDAFYASVELLRRPELRDLPVAIGGRGDPTRRGVVTTANYVARRYGIRSAMPLRQAYQLCPQCVFLPVDFDEYRKYSRLFKAAIVAIAPDIEDRGIDEVYADLSSQPGDSAAIGHAIKSAIRDATGLSCSLGIAPNKLLAKICSDLDKPDGLTLLTREDIPSRIWPLPARRINGIGPKASARLASMGIETIGQLAATPLESLTLRFGPSYGRWLHAAAHGEDNRPIVSHSEPRSRSRETTFDQDLHPVLHRDTLNAIFVTLCERVAGDLQRGHYLARTIGIKLRFADFSTLTRDLTLPEPTADTVQIRRAARECLRRVHLQRPLRLLGVRAAGLVGEDAWREQLAEMEMGKTLPLF